MAFSELIKSFDKTRRYLRDFFVNGFKTRDDYTIKSLRAYDDEKRRIENWLGEYVRYRQVPGGKASCVVVASRDIDRNPLFRAWRTKSFTDKDITLYFHLLNCLNNDKWLGIREIEDRVTDSLFACDSVIDVDASTIRKKLKEMNDDGILEARAKKNAFEYRLSENVLDKQSWAAAAEYFSEVAVNASGNDFTEIKALIHNRTGWPARSANNVEFRYFIDLTTASS